MIEPYWKSGSDRATLYHGDVLGVLRQLPDESVQCVVTSPPYWGLRDYGTDGQIGLEPTPAEYLERIVAVFAEVRRVLRRDGTCFVNMGDGYASQGGRGEQGQNGQRADRTFTYVREASTSPPPGLKPKDLIGMPWMLAFALQSDGWYLRADIIWAKPNPMPESVTDRPTKAHEYVFLLTRSPRYFWDAEAVRENGSESSAERYKYDFSGTKGADLVNDRRTVPEGKREFDGLRNCRSVWTIPTQAFPEAHFATFPEALVEKCLKAGTSERGACATCGAPWRRVVERDRKATRPGRDNVRDETGLANRDYERHVTETKTVGWEPGCDCGSTAVGCLVLDPFTGSGTTGLVACRMGQRFVGLDLNAEYLDMARRRIGSEADQGILFDTP